MLASRSLHKTANASFFRLPPHLRVSAWQLSTKRSFSASTPRQSSLVEAAVTPPIAVLNTLHAIGLPWYAVIPLTAILARGVFGYYFGTLPARRRAAIRTDLVPLVTARVNARTRHDEATGLYRGKKNAESQRRWNQGLGKIVNQLVLSRAFGAGFFRPTSFVNFGVLIAFTESVRVKCGARDGLLSAVLTPFQWVATKINPSRFPPAPDHALEAKVRYLEDMRAQAMESGEWPAQDLNTLAPEVQTPSLPDETSPFFDHSLQIDGLSFCPDLSLPDPTGVLSLTLFAVMSGSILIKPKHNGRWFPLNYTPLQRLSLIISALFYYVTLQLPAGVMLYLTSSMAIGAVQRRWLDVTAPLRVPIQPCKRPTRIKVKKQWSD